MQLSTEDFQRLVVFLRDLPQLATEPGRHAILDFAGLSQFTSTIDLSGDTFVVASKIVKQLSSYGRIEDGSYALGKFIKAIKQFTGAENQGWLDDLINRYEIGEGSINHPLVTDLTKKWRILILSANPRNTEQLSLNEEVREIQEAIRRSHHSSNFFIKTAGAVRTIDIRRAILDHKPNLIHFSGHGKGEDGLVVEGRSGTHHLLGGEALAKLFKLHSDTVECVVLNACYSEIQATAISRYIHYVISMSNTIGDDAAIEFSIGFYDALGAGISIKDAYEYGCNAIFMEGMEGHQHPVLTSRKQAGDPEKILPGDEPNSPPDPSPPVTTKHGQTKLWIGGTFIGLIIAAISVYAVNKTNSLPDSRKSLGENFLIADNNNPDKEEASKLFRNGNYEGAIQALEALLTKNPNDPEALIYLNNSIIAERKRTDESIQVAKIGVSVPISGISKDRAEEILRGVSQAQLKENCGEISGILEEIKSTELTISCDEGIQNNGFLLQVEIADDSGDSGKHVIAKKVAKSFGDDRSILAVVGHADSSVTEAVIEVYDAFQLTVISPTSSATNLTGKSKFFFRTVPTDEGIAEAFIQYATDRLTGKMSVCYNSESLFSRSFANNVSDSQKEYGDTDFLPVGGKCDFKGSQDQESLKKIILQNIGEDNANGLLIIPSTTDIKQAIQAIDSVKRVRELEYVIGSTSMYTGETLNGKNKNILGTVVLTPWDPSISKEAQEFASEAKSLWKSPVGTWRTPMAYDAILALVISLKSGLEREDVSQNMLTTEFNGATGNVKFESWGNRIGGKTYFAEIIENTSEIHAFKVIFESE